MNLQCTGSRVVQFTHRLIAANFGTTRLASTTILSRSTATAYQKSDQPKNDDDGENVTKDDVTEVRPEEYETDPFLKNEIKKYNTGMVYTLVM